MLHKELRGGEYGTNTLFDNTQPWFRGRVTGDTHDRLRLDPIAGLMLGDGTGEPVSMSDATLGMADLKPTGAIAETIDRAGFAGITDQASILATGTLQVTAIGLTAGTVVTNIALLSGTTAAGTPTHTFFVLLDKSLNVLAKSADNTNGAWAANTLLALALTAPFTCTYTGLYYIGVVSVATTPPSLAGVASGNAAVNTLAPVVAGSSTTGVTTPASLTSPVTAITAGTQRFYAYVS